MRFRDLKPLVQALLDERASNPGSIDIVPGPFDPDKPGRYVILTGYGGPGEDLDGTLDQVSWQARSVGAQNDFDDAEDIALAIDRGFLSWYSAPMPDSGLWLAGIQRVGGAPNPLLRDNADRTHFVCSYIFSIELALAN